MCSGTRNQYVKADECIGDVVTYSYGGWTNDILTVYMTSVKREKSFFHGL